MRTKISKIAWAVAFVLGAGLAPRAQAASKVKIGYASDDVDKAKRAGFDYAELGVRNFAKLTDEEFGKLQEKLKELKLPTPVGNNFIPGDLKVVGPEIDKDKQMEYVRTAFDRAKKLGLKVIVFGSGGSRKAPDGFSSDEAFTQLVDFAKRIAPEAKKRGIVVAVEPLQKGETNTINTAAEGLKWVQAVNHPNFQLMIDFYHLSLEKEDPTIVVTAKKNLKHIHIANPVKRRFPLSADEFDYSAFFANLRKINYQGLISVEGRSDDFDVEGPKAVAFLRAAAAEGVKPPAGPTPPASPPGGGAVVGGVAGGVKPAAPAGKPATPPAKPGAPAPTPPPK
jgi:sugar phosphate isomerase/epimerase